MFLFYIQLNFIFYLFDFYSISCNKKSFSEYLILLKRGNTDTFTNLF